MPTPAAKPAAGLFTRRLQRGWLLAAALGLIAACAFALRGLGGASLWYDEAWTAWASGGGAPNTFDLPGTLARVSPDVHPPLYYLLLDGWTALVGESEFMLRLPSLYSALLALAAVYALGRRLFDPLAGLLALVVLAASGFWLYYAREARMYAPLLALAALATHAYLRWRARPSRRRAVVYALLLVAALYTHYAGALIAVTHGLHGLGRWAFDRRDRAGIRLLRQWLAVLAGASLLYLPWLPTLLAQTRTHPGGPLALPVPTSWDAVLALAAVLTSGHAALLFAPCLLGSLDRLRRGAAAFGLLALWLLVTPAGMLLLNAAGINVYQVRYTIGVLPALALLIAFGLRHTGGWLQWGGWRSPLRVLLVMGWTAAIVYTQITMYGHFWPGKPRYRDAFTRMIAAREAGEPTLAHIAYVSVEAYYARRLGLHDAATLDLRQRVAAPPAVARSVVAALDGAPSVWAVLPSNVASSWDAGYALDAGRGIGYRDFVENMVLYRFDAGRGDDLAFRFGDLLRYDGLLGEPITARAGDLLCLVLPFTVLRPLDGVYSASVQVLDAGRGLVSQWDGGLGAPESGASLVLDPCLELLPVMDAPFYHAQIVIYDRATGRPLSVFEGPDARVYWGEGLVLGEVRVERR